MKHGASKVFRLLLVFIGSCLIAGPLAPAQSNAAESITASSIGSVLREAEAAERRFDSKTALTLYRQANDLRPRDAVILQKISRQYSDLATDSSDEGERVRLCTEGLSYAENSVELAPNNAVNVLSVAICYGKLALWSDLRTRIRYSKLVREYAERALKLNPNYDYAHHVLGRWHYEIATLGATKRWLVRMIYGGLPPASLTEAIAEFKRAAELAPDLPAHRLELGFAQLANGNRDAARATFEQALAMPIREKHETEVRHRAQEALEQLRKESR